MATKTDRIPEIMAPAGDFINLSAALRAGADAVYFGLKGWNMRAAAKNFTPAELSKVVRECSKYGAKTYLTLNNIYYQFELPKLRDLIKRAKNAGVDAIISWDFAAIEAAREFEMPVYLSTQASVSNATAIASYKKNFGISRFVLARECTLEDIKKIRKALRKELPDCYDEIKLEVFAHGAMCVSLSGRCFLSGFACGKSANRGECRQMCRREYNISDTRDATLNFKIGSGYVLSPKDLCTLGFIEKIFEAGVDSLKIEGRNRNAAYVEATVSAYKRARDFYFANRRRKDFSENFANLKTELVENMGDVFNRGFSEGFYMGVPMGDWTSAGNLAAKKKAIVGHVLNYYPKAKVAHVSVDDATLRVGDEIQIEGDSTGFVKVRITEMRDDSGKNVNSVSKGRNATFLCAEKLKRMDRIFKMV